jgi:hypothetical protein
MNSIGSSRKKSQWNLVIMASEKVRTDHRELGAHDPAQPDQREGEEAYAQGFIETLLPFDVVLEHEDQGQDREPEGQDGDIDPSLAPDIMPERNCRRFAPGVRGGLQIGRRQAVGSCEGGEDSPPVAGLARDQDLQAPGRDDREAGRLAQHENRQLAQVRSAFQAELFHPEMVLLPEPDRVFALHQLDAVENAAADIGGPLEGIEPAARHEEQLVVLGQVRHEPVVDPAAQEVAADPGGRGQAGMELEKGRVRIGRRDGPGIEPPAAAADRGLGVADGDPKGNQGLIRAQGIPARRGEAFEIQPGLLRTEESPAARHDTGRAQDHVAEHHRRDRRAGHRVDAALGAPRAARDAHRIAYVEAPVLGDEGRKVPVGDADHQDRLLVLEDHGAGYAPVQVDTGQDVQRLAGKPRGGHHLLGGEHIADQRAVPVGRGRRRRAFHWAEGRGRGEDLGKTARDLGRTRRLRGVHTDDRGEQQKHGRQARRCRPGMSHTRDVWCHPLRSNPPPISVQRLTARVHARGGYGAATNREGLDHGQGFGRTIDLRLPHHLASEGTS